MYKMNPVAFGLLYVLLFKCIFTVLLSNDSIADKLAVVLLGAPIFFIALGFEAWRVAREEELEEAAWKTRFGSEWVKQ